MTKFLPTGQPVDEFLDEISSEVRRSDAIKLIRIYKEITKTDPIMWYPGIIGFGEYVYKTDSGIGGRSPTLAFAPRKQNISLYISKDLPKRDGLLEKLGKHREGASCVYINKLADINLDILKEILISDYEFTKAKKDMNDG